MKKEPSSKLTSEINNPCLKEQELTYKCLNDVNFDHEKCANYFLNYNTCKKFWNQVRADRRAQGIWPRLPPPEEREQIKAEYFKAAKVGQ